MSRSQKTNLAVGVSVLLVALVVGYACWIRGGVSRPVEEGEGDAPLVTLISPRRQVELEAQDTEIDPAISGWESEVVAESVTGQAKVLSELISAGKQASQSQLDMLVTGDFSTSVLRDTGDSIERGKLAIHRSDGSPSLLDAKGGKAFASALKGLQEPFIGASESRVKLKVISIALDGDRCSAKLSYEASGATKVGRFQQNAIWDSEWKLAQATAPRLVRIGLLRFEEKQLDGEEAWYSDRTADVVGADMAFKTQVSFGLHHWLRRIERIHGSLYFKRHGLSVADVNGDGLDDVYLCQPGGLPNRLFLHQPNGLAIDEAAKYGVDFLDQTASALFVDLDNDGDQDLALATSEGMQLLEQNASGVFERKSLHQLRDTDLLALSAADYDLDGDLDLYVTVDFADRSAYTNEALPGFLYHDANDGGANVLLENAGAWKFTDATLKTGLDQHNRRHSLAAAWEDYDNDGDPDLYVANDYGKNCLYQNQLVPDGKAHFLEIAESVGLVDSASGMSVSWGDPNRDGIMDLYVGNMFSSAGNRITRQQQFLPKANGEVRSLYQRFAKGNSLFLGSDGSEGKGFVEAGEEANVEMGRWSWSSPWVDINNDGWEDLIVANGYITTEDKGDL